MRSVSARGRAPPPQIRLLYISSSRLASKQNSGFPGLRHTEMILYDPLTCTWSPPCLHDDCHCRLLALLFFCLIFSHLRFVLHLFFVLMFACMQALLAYVDVEVETERGKVRYPLSSLVLPCRLPGSLTRCLLSNTFINVFYISPRVQIIQGEEPELRLMSTNGEESSDDPLPIIGYDKYRVC